MNRFIAKRDPLRGISPDESRISVAGCLLSREVAAFALFFHRANFSTSSFGKASELSRSEPVISGGMFEDCFEKPSD